MQVGPVAGHLLDGVPKGVTEIEEGAAAAGGELALVGLDEPRLDFAAAADHAGQSRVSGNQGSLLQDIQESRVAQEPVLDDLRHARREFTLGKRLEQVRPDEDRLRLMERPGKVLARGKVDARLSADRAVHHGQKRGRHLIVGDPPQVRGRRESPEVTHDAAAEGKQDAHPVDALPGKEIEHGPQHLHGLGTFARRHLGPGERAKHPPHLGSQGCGDAAIGDHGRPATRFFQGLHGGLDGGHDVGRKRQGVAALSQIDLEVFGHRLGVALLHP